MFKNSKRSRLSQDDKRGESAVVSELTVFYDGGCRVCAREMAHYRGLDRSGRLRWIDISAPGFDPQSHGAEAAQLMAAMHARSADGRWHVGVAAFVAIWQRLPGRLYPVLVALATSRIFSPLLGFGYRLFARYRHLLPRRAGTCPAGGCEPRGPANTRGG